jgi:hypothetical protein
MQLLFQAVPFPMDAIQMNNNIIWEYAQLSFANRFRLFVDFNFRTFRAVIPIVNLFNWINLLSDNGNKASSFGYMSTSLRCLMEALFLRTSQEIPLIRITEAAF